MSNMSAQVQSMTVVATTGSRRQRQVKAAAPPKDQYKATKLCKFFVAGACTRGTACTFAHSGDEVRELPDYSKTRLCETFMKTGRCANGSACNYAHGKEEMQQAAQARKKRAQKDKKVAAPAAAAAAVATAFSAPGTLPPTVASPASAKQFAQVAVQAVPECHPQFWVTPGPCQVMMPTVVRGIQLIPVAGPFPNHPGMSFTSFSESSTECERRSTEHELPDLDSLASGSGQSTPRMARRASGSSSMARMPDQMFTGDNAGNYGLSPVVEQPAGKALSDGNSTLAISVKNSFIHVEEPEASPLYGARVRSSSMPARL